MAEPLMCIDTSYLKCCFPDALVKTHFLLLLSEVRRELNLMKDRVEVVASGSSVVGHIHGIDSF